MIRPHERIRVEQSLKYSAAEAEELWKRAGMTEIDQWRHLDEYGECRALYHLIWRAWGFLSSTPYTPHPTFLCHVGPVIRYPPWFVRHTGRVVTRPCGLCRGCQPRSPGPPDHPTLELLAPYLGFLRNPFLLT
jgi:hypothetical protein